MQHGRKLILGGSAAALVAAAVGWQALRPDSATAQQAARVDAPMFQVNPLWPTPLPDHMVLGSVTGVAIDDRDHIFVVNHARSYHGNELNIENNSGECCRRPGIVLEFNPQGMLVRTWGGLGQGDWSEYPGAIAVDPQGNVWIGGAAAPAGGGGRGGAAAAALAARAGGAGPAGDAAAAGRGGAAAGGAAAGRGGAAAGGAGRGGAAAGGGAAADAPAGGAAAGAEAPASSGVVSHILKFTRDGRYLGTIGQVNQAANSQSRTSFGGVARISFDAAANEAYLADGYANKRVVVVDITTGEVKRMWGAYGNTPSDSAQTPYNADTPLAQYRNAYPQFRTVTCAVPSTDGMVYVCDRGNNRIQVFRKDGTFVREAQIMPRTLGEGSVWDAALSRDAQQRYLFVADGMNERVHVLDRQTLEILTSFGTGGRYPGHFVKLSSIAVDSRGNLYTGEDLNGHRVQKFEYRGMGPVTSRDQGPLWPTN
jgi:hypothetical protein